MVGWTMPGSLEEGRLMGEPKVRVAQGKFQGREAQGELNDGEVYRGSLAKGRISGNLQGGRLTEESMKGL